MAQEDANAQAAFQLFGSVLNVIADQAAQQQQNQQYSTQVSVQPTIQPGGLTQDQVLIVQQMLNEKGFDVGIPDGIVGPRTRVAVAQVQIKAGVQVTGLPSQELLEALLGAK
jgi:peptidoglycan hydrolase-like protein with peptidoglycan-binding domain